MCLALLASYSVQLKAQNSNEPKGRTAILGKVMGYVNLPHRSVKNCLNQLSFDIACISVDSVLCGNAPKYAYFLVPDGIVATNQDGKPITFSKSSEEPWGCFKRGDNILIVGEWSPYWNLYAIRYFRFLSKSQNESYSGPIRKLVDFDYNYTAWDTLPNHRYTVDELRASIERHFEEVNESLDQVFQEAVSRCKQKKKLN